MLNTFDWFKNLGQTFHGSILLLYSCSEVLHEHSKLNNEVSITSARSFNSLLHSGFIFFKFRHFYLHFKIQLLIQV